jgi:hypothetical protein
LTSALIVSSFGLETQNEPIIARWGRVAFGWLAI